MRDIIWAIFAVIGMLATAGVVLMLIILCLYERNDKRIRDRPGDDEDDSNKEYDDADDL